MVFFQLIEKDEINELKLRLLVNSNVIKEYENWVAILLNIMNLKDEVDKHYDLGTPIEKVIAYNISVLID